MDKSSQSKGIEYIGAIDIPYSVGQIERIVNGNKIELSELNEVYRRKFHSKFEPLSNPTGEKGFLDFVQRGPNSCDIFSCATYPEYQRRGEFENMLKYLKELCDGRRMSHIYAQVDENNTPMLGTMSKYGFERTGSIESLECFEVNVSKIKV